MGPVVDAYRDVHAALAAHNISLTPDEVEQLARAAAVGRAVQLELALHPDGKGVDPSQELVDDVYDLLDAET
jgi:hypothetical protein